MLICNISKSWPDTGPGTARKKLTVFVVDPSKMAGYALCKVFGEIEPEVSFVPERSINQIVWVEGGTPVLVTINVGVHSLSSGWVRRELLLAASLGLPVTVLCGSSDRSEVVEGIRLGVRGYIPADFSPTAAISAMKLVHAGEMFTPASTGQARAGMATPGPEPSRRSEGRRAEEHACSSVLTPRERAVLDLICVGRPNKLIARELDIEASTVKVHVKNIMRKLDVTNRTQLCALMHGVEPQAIFPPKVFAK